MPYIDQRDRESFYPKAEPAITAGQLNYQLTCIVNQYMEHKGKSYATINDIVGALEGAKLEFYRRVAAKYEDEKIIQNGDIY